MELIVPGAVVDHRRLGRGTVLNVRGAFASIYFAQQEGTKEGPWWDPVDRAGSDLSLVESSGDPPRVARGSYGVYVIELRPTAPTAPRGDRHKPFVYVGVSGNTPA